jgi:hypothetical protein
MSTSHNMLNTLEVLGLQATSILEEMEDLFPPITPSPSDSISTIMYRSGQRSVVEWLQQRLEN